MRQIRRVVFSIAILAAGPLQAQTPARDTLTANRFRFEIGGKAVPGALKVTVGAITIPLVAYSSGGEPVKRYLPGKPVYGSLRIEKAADSDTSFKEIAKAPLSGANARRDAALILLSPNGSELRRISFYRCLPTKYEPGDIAPRAGLIRETLELAPERVELSSPGAAALALPLSSIKLMASARSRGLSASKFTVDIKGTGAAVTESAWKSVQGGGIKFDLITVRTGADSVATNTLGRSEATELELLGTASPGAHPASLAWLKDVLTGASNPKRTVTVRIFAQDGSLAASRTYNDCLITSYSLSTFDSASTAEVEERITIKPGAYSP